VKESQEKNHFFSLPAFLLIFATFSPLFAGWRAAAAAAVTLRFF